MKAKVDEKSRQRHPPFIRSLPFGSPNLSVTIIARTQLHLSPSNQFCLFQIWTLRCPLMSYAPIYLCFRAFVRFWTLAYAMASCSHTHPITPALFTIFKFSWLLFIYLFKNHCSTFCFFVSYVNLHHSSFSFSCCKYTL
ncbi:hypothetical protein BJ165DRAFT_735761 [Panaeolus papilionaceus]|nr:hypothetical protein BJ165DRAFT_735761 [Panaeolus papilionaceus]